MERREFKAESKRLLDLMVNSIYTHKEIFLRELISNSSDAIDKMYYEALTNEDINFNKDDFYIKIIPNKDNRTLTIYDTGIGMDKSELENNLGTIAESGSLKFKKAKEKKEEIDIIGQFGIGFYSAFMVADKITVKTKTPKSETGYIWESEGAEGYTIKEFAKANNGTEIILKLKENSEDENYDEFLEEYRLESLVKKYSDFIRYPIKMDFTERKELEKEENDESEEPKYEEVIEERVLNTMIPMWKKNKNSLKEEDYINFYKDKKYGFDEPLKYVHMKADGTIRYNSIIYIPSEPPFDFYTKEYEKGLELYSSGVLIMDKCSDLLPDYFSFVKGMVDSEDLSLNISREILQHDRQLKIIAKKIKDKVKSTLKTMMKNDREMYEKFFSKFGKQIKFGVYDGFGQNKDFLKDLLIFHSSKENKMITLEEYISNMKEDQKNIYYASGESIEKIDKMPQVEGLKDEGFDILYFTDEVDEFAIKILMNYDDKEFKSVQSADIETDQEDDQNDEQKDKEREIFNEIKSILGDKVKDVKASKRLKNHAVCLASQGDLSIEMEKVLNQMPDSNNSMKSEKVLEINTNHKMFEGLKHSFENDKDKLKSYANVLYNQALLIEGLNPEDPVEYTNDIFNLLG